jgi:beta-glucosidase
VSFTVTNVGKRTGADTPQLYVSVPGAGGDTLRHLVGWRKLTLAPGESRRVRLAADPRLLAHFDETQPGWHLTTGNYRVELGASSSDLRLAARAHLEDRTLPP